MREFKLIKMELTKLIVGFYILAILTGLCNILHLNLSLLQKRLTDYKKKSRVLTILLQLGTNKYKGKRKRDGDDSGRDRDELLLGGRTLKRILF